MGLQLPDYVKSARHAGSLDPEIAGEGVRVLDHGEAVSYNPPAAKPVTPDWSAIKSIKHLFYRTGYEVYPAWLFHPTEPARRVEDADEAARLGVYYRKTKPDEMARHGLAAIWDWDEGCLWRPRPYGDGKQKIDPNHIDHGKNLITSAPNPIAVQNALLEALIPTVTGAVVTALRSGGAPTAPGGIDPKQWDEFQAFLAWKKTQEAVSELKEDPGELGLQGGALSVNGLSPEQDRALWEEEAKRLGIKVDGRWSNERLREECEKKASRGS